MDAKFWFILESTELVNLEESENPNETGAAKERRIIFTAKSRASAESKAEVKIDRLQRSATRADAERMTWDGPYGPYDSHEEAEEAEI